MGGSVLKWQNNKYFEVILGLGNPLCYHIIIMYINSQHN